MIFKFKLLIKTILSECKLSNCCTDVELNKCSSLVVLLSLIIHWLYIDLFLKTLLVFFCSAGWNRNLKSDWLLFFFRVQTPIRFVTFTFSQLGKVSGQTRLNNLWWQSTVGKSSVSSIVNRNRHDRSSMCNSLVDWLCA